MGEGFEQAGDILDRAAHRAIGGKLVQEGVADRIGGHEAVGRAQAVDVAECGRIAQAAHHVRAVGDGDEACGECGGGPAGGAAGRAAEVVGVVGDAEHRVEAVRAKAEFGRVGLADQDRARRAEAGGQQVVLVRDQVGEDR